MSEPSPTAVTICESAVNQAAGRELPTSLQQAGQAVVLANQPLTSGAFAQELIHRQIRRLGKLQAEVLADRDPEPLHQLRVSLRRLRTALLQFGPALELPESVSERRIAAVARRTSLCRDLDVLQHRMRNQLLPRLPDEEQRSLEGAMKRLARDRAQAFGGLVEALHSSRYLKLLERLHKWQKRPRFTPLGERPLQLWLADWQAPLTAGLFLHPGWSVTDPAAEALHELRKRIKAARYCLENLEPWCDASLLAWIEDLRQAQDHLGELHDLQILNRSLKEGGNHRKRKDLPVLHAELEGQQLQHWLRWHELSQRLLADSNRSSIQRQLLQLGRNADPLVT